MYANDLIFETQKSWLCIQQKRQFTIPVYHFLFFWELIFELMYYLYLFVYLLYFLKKLIFLLKRNGFGPMKAAKLIKKGTAELQSLLKDIHCIMLLAKNYI